MKIAEHKKEVERIENLIRNHCLCVKLDRIKNGVYRVQIAEGYGHTRFAQSGRATSREALCDIAMHLEKLWIWLGVKSYDECVELVKKYRAEHNLHQ